MAIIIICCLHVNVPAFILWQAVDCCMFQTACARVLSDIDKTFFSQVHSALFDCIIFHAVKYC